MIPVPCALLLGAWANGLLGTLKKALASGADSLSLAERIAHPFTLGPRSHFPRVLHLIAANPSEP